MELNREQIIKALECCHTPLASDCNDCGYRGQSVENGKYIGCTNRLLADALALIKELTEQGKKDTKLINELIKEAETYLAQRECFQNQVKNLTEENERLRDGCTQLIRYPTLYEALEAIIWYDGHSEWLKELCEKLEKAKQDNVYYPMDDIEWHTEQHTIWMLLVGMFGDWGTSIRSGWIEKHDECIAFINKIIESSEDT